MRIKSTFTSLKGIVSAIAHKPEPISLESTVLMWENRIFLS